MRKWSQQLHLRAFITRRFPHDFKHLYASEVICQLCFPRHSQIIDDAIDISLKKRNEPLLPNLTPQDIFYVKVTRLQEFFKSLGYIIDETVHQEQSSTKASQFMLDVGKIYLVCIS